MPTPMPEHVKDANLTDEERDALARALVTFPGTTIGPLEPPPVKEEPPTTLAQAIRHHQEVGHG
jgi:hypothetical protein